MLVNELFYSLQGEGYWTGRPAVFCRFSGCNLWSGYEEDRSSAVCQFCDTDFVSGTAFSELALADAIVGLWKSSCRCFVVLTGGEPTLQLTPSFVQLLKDRGCYVALETNGTKEVIVNVDWITVSPKTPRIRQQVGDELKLVYPQTSVFPEDFQGMAFDHWFIQPCSGSAEALDYCLANPPWRLSLQTHKLLGIR